MKSFHDPNLPEDTRLVLESASLLDITEYRLFELAYSDWFGDSPISEQVEPFFAKYMFKGIIPVWVRQFARKIMSEYRSGKIKTAQSSRPAAPLRGGVYILALFVSLLVLVLSATSSTDLLPAVQECYFPPCY